MSCRVALPLVGGPASLTYWPAIPLVAVLLGGATLPALLLLEQLELTILQAGALMLLLWPAAGTAIRRLHDRRTLGWLCLPAYLAAIVLFMAARFGKPAVLGHSAVAELVPLVAILFLLAWLVVDGLTIEEASGEVAEVPASA